MAKKKVKTSRQLMSYYVDNESDVVLIEEGRYNLDEKNPNIETTVIIGDGHSIRVAETKVDADVMRTVMEADKRMYWQNFETYFDLAKTRVITMYLQKNAASLEDCADSLAGFVYEKNIKGNILLIGRGKAGLVMYEAAETITRIVPKVNVTVITVDAPFGGTFLATRSSFHEMMHQYPRSVEKFFYLISDDNLTDKDIEVGASFLDNIAPVSKKVRHIAFIGSISNKLYRPENKYDKKFELLDDWCGIEGDGFSSFASQESWPRNQEGKKRYPDLCLIVPATYASCLDKVLRDYSKYAKGAYFFDDFEEFKAREEKKAL